MSTDLTKEIVDYLFLNEVVSSSNLTQKEISETLDISDAYMSMLMNRSKPVSKKIIRNLTKIYNGSYEEFQTKIQQPEFSQVITLLNVDPILERATTGYINFKGKK